MLIDSSFFFHFKRRFCLKINYEFDIICLFGVINIIMSCSLKAANSKTIQQLLLSFTGPEIQVIKSLPDQYNHRQVGKEAYL